LLTVRAMGGSGPKLWGLPTRISKEAKFIGGT
jgi:hypothetical protein